MKKSWREMQSSDNKILNFRDEDDDKNKSEGKAKADPQRHYHCLICKTS